MKIQQKLEQQHRAWSRASKRARNKEDEKNYNRATYLFVIDMDGKKKEAVKPNYMKLLSQVLRHNIVNTILNTP